MYFYFYYHYFLSKFSPARESHFAIVFLVLQHVDQVVEQLATVATYQDVGVAWGKVRR